MTRKLEASSAALADEGSAALQEASRKFAEAQEKLETLALKLSGSEEALTKTNDKLKQSECKVAEMAKEQELAEERSAELVRCKDTIREALSNLDITTRKNQSLEEALSEFVSETERLHLEFIEAQKQLTDTLSDLGIVTEDNVSLRDQVQQLAAQAAENEKFRAKADMLKGALEKMDAAQKQLKAEKEAVLKEKEAVLKEVDAVIQQKENLQVALAKAKAENSSSGETLEKERQKSAQLEAQVAQVEAQVAQASKTREGLEAKLAAAEEMAGDSRRLIEEEKAKTVTMKEAIDLAYQKSICAYHSWLVQNTFNVAVAAVPTWTEARDNLDGLDVAGEEGLMKSIAALDPVLGRMEAALKARDLWDVRQV